MENNFSRFVVFLLHKALLLAGDPVKLLSPCDSPGQSHPAAQSPDKEPKAFAKCTQIGGRGDGGGDGGGNRGALGEKGRPTGGRRCGVAPLGVPVGRGWGVGTMEDPIEVGVGAAECSPIEGRGEWRDLHWGEGAAPPPTPQPPEFCLTQPPPPSPPPPSLSITSIPRRGQGTMGTLRWWGGRGVFILTPTSHTPPPSGIRA